MHSPLVKGDLNQMTVYGSWQLLIKACIHQCDKNTDHDDTDRKASKAI